MYKVIVQSSMLRHQKKLRKEEEIEERCKNKYIDDRSRFYRQVQCADM